MKDFLNRIEITDAKRKEFKHVSSLFHTIVCSANDIADSAVRDALDEIKKAGLYRHQVKKACKDTISRYADFERRNFEDMKGTSTDIDKRQMYMDFLDAVGERLSPHVFKFRMSVKQLLDREGLPGSDLKAYIITADQLLEYAVFLFDKFFDNVPPIPPVDLRKTFIAARLSPSLHAWKTVVRSVCPDCADIDFDSDKNCKLAFDIIETNIVTEQYINSSGMEALRLNPETAEKVKQKEKIK